VSQLHFTSWPDHGVPFYPQSVAAYLKQLLLTPRGNGPILVHCSAGVGRTGTIILADICLRMAAAEGAVDILGFQQSMREERPNMVDNLVSLFSHNETVNRTFDLNGMSGHMTLEN
ncbi:unnamed protein product, partial [Timema podura]|nr:unnamed protein product [Timema podura]